MSAIKQGQIAAAADAALRIQRHQAAEFQRAISAAMAGEDFVPADLPAGIVERTMPMPIINKLLSAQSLKMAPSLLRAGIEAVVQDQLEFFKEQESQPVPPLSMPSVRELGEKVAAARRAEFA